MFVGVCVCASVRDALGASDSCSTHSLSIKHFVSMATASLHTFHSLQMMVDLVVSGVGQILDFLLGVCTVYFLWHSGFLPQSKTLHLD